MNHMQRCRSVRMGSSFSTKMGPPTQNCNRSYQKYPPQANNMSVNAGETPDELAARIDAYVVQPSMYPDDQYMKICCQQALLAVKQGNFGIGNCIVDTLGTLTGVPGTVVGVGHNQLMYPYFRSDGHGEMVTLDEFEEKLANGFFGRVYGSSDPLPAGLTLYTQLESCQMCLARIANSGIARCLYGAPDNGGGAVHLMCQLPPTYISLLNRQKHDVARVSPEMIQLCFDAFNINVGEVATKLNARSGPNTVQQGYCLPQYGSAVRSTELYDVSGYNREAGWEPYCN